MIDCSSCNIYDNDTSYMIKYYICIYVIYRYINFALYIMI